MIIEIYGEQIECSEVIKKSNSILVLGEYGEIIREDFGIANFDGYMMLEGEWTECEEAPTAEERIAELEAINAELEDALCEMDVVNQEQQRDIAYLKEANAAIEDALCEIDMG